MVHVGKCGGSTLREALRQSELIKRRYKRVRRYHLSEPKFIRSADYVFVVRNPVARALSAFNYRYFHVVATEGERNRFDGEFEVLSKYGDLNTIAEALYSNGTLNSDAVRDFSRIHHLGDENFSFYLEPVLESVSSKRIFAVFVTDYLDADIPSLLDVKPFRKRVTRHNVPDRMLQLSDSARKNLREYFSADYRVLAKLAVMSGLEDSRTKALLEG